MHWVGESGNALWPGALVVPPCWLTARPACARSERRIRRRAPGRNRTAPTPAAARRRVPAGSCLPVPRGLSRRSTLDLQLRSRKVTSTLRSRSPPAMARMILMPVAPGDVADDVVQLQVHEGQRLLHVLDVGCGVVQLPLSKPQVGSKRSNVAARSDARSQQATGVQPLKPLRIVDIALAPGRGSRLATRGRWRQSLRCHGYQGSRRQGSSTHR